jgi:hypothetical protein
MIPPTAHLHLGDLHAFETVLLALLAFGPFVVLVVVVFAIRRRDLDDTDDDVAEGTENTSRDGDL